MRHAGLLELTEERIRFVADDGTEVFSGPLNEVRLRFPRRLPDGLIVSMLAGDVTVLFSDPHVEWSGGNARTTRRDWMRALHNLAR